MEIFVLQCLSGKEDRVREKLDGLVEDAAASIIIPRRKMSNRRRGKNEENDYLLFPGYLFIQVEHIDQCWIEALRQIPEAARLLPDNQNARPLNPAERDLVRQLVYHGESIGPSAVRFDENRRIVVIDGPMQGLEGKIIKVDRRKGRARVKLDMYDRNFTVDFPFYDLSAREAADT